MSTVQEVKAEERNSSSIINNNWDAIRSEVIGNIQKFFATKDFVVGDSVGGPEYSAILDEIDAALTSEYAEKGLTITTSGVNNNTIDSNKSISISLTVSDNQGNNRNEIVPVSIEAWSAADVLNQLDIDWDGLSFADTNNDNTNDTTAKNIASDALTNALEAFEDQNATVYSKFIYSDPEVTVNNGTAFTTWDFKVTVTNKNLTSDTASKTGTISMTESNTDADEALSYLKENLNTVTVGADVDISVNAETIINSADGKTTNGEKIADAIEGAANTIFVGTDYQPNGSKEATVNVTALSMSGDGQVTAAVTVSANGDAATANLSLKLVKSDSTTIVAMEVVDAETEIEVSTGELSDAFSGIKVTYADESSKVIAFADLANAGITYDIIKWNADRQKVGSTTVTFVSASGVSVPLTLQVVKTHSKTAEEWGFADKNAPLTTVSSDDESVITGSINTAGEIVLKAKNAGSATVTVTNEKGQSYARTIEVSANGSIRMGDAAPVNTVLNIAASVAKFGFVAHPENDTNKVEIVSENVTDPLADGVVEAELTTVGDQPVIQLTPVGDGTAELKITGGDNGKLTATLDVKVTDGVITITDKVMQEYASVSLNQAAIDHLRSLVYADDINPTIEELGFTDEDKLIVETKGTNLEESVPASDATKAEYNAADKELTIYYGNQSAVVQLASNECNVPNSVTELGLVATDYSIEQVTDVIKDVEFTTTAQGDPIILITPEDIESGNATITVSDELGNEATISVTVKNGVATAKVKKTFKLAGEWKVVVPNGTQLYTIGDSVDVTSCHLECTKAGVGVEVDDIIELDNNMITKFNSTSATLNGDDLKYEQMFVSYGGLNIAIDYAVRPASTTVSESSLGLASSDNIASVAVSGTSDLGASLNGAKDTITIQANKVNISGSVIVTTTEGNTVAIKVSVDGEGNIETSVTREFESSVSVVDNTEETLGIVGTETASSDESVVLASIAGGKVVLTSVAPGTAVVTVTDGNLTAELNVTVDEFGTITIDNIKKATEDGFMRGDLIEEGPYAGQYNWYYYIDGEKVTNDWVSVDENGTEVWYHFDKDGKMQRGWIKDETGWKLYYLDANGRMYHDIWANANANEALNMPAGMYYLQYDGSAQMNGWAKAPGAEEIYWYCAAGTGVFDASNPANWATEKLW